MKLLNLGNHSCTHLWTNWGRWVYFLEIQVFLCGIQFQNFQSWHVCFSFSYRNFHRPVNTLWPGGTRTLMPEWPTASCQQEATERPMTSWLMILMARFTLLARWVNFIPLWEWMWCMDVMSLRILYEAGLKGMGCCHTLYECIYEHNMLHRWWLTSVVRLCKLCPTLGMDVMSLHILRSAGLKRTRCSQLMGKYTRNQYSL